MKKVLLALAVAGAISASVTTQADGAMYGRRLRLRSYSGRKCHRPDCDKAPFKSKPYCSAECARLHKAQMSSHKEVQS
jgi:hypothetical protein